jgi:hypothetical protein
MVASLSDVTICQEATTNRRTCSSAESGPPKLWMRQTFGGSLETGPSKLAPRSIRGCGPLLEDGVMNLDGITDHVPNVDKLRVGLYMLMSSFFAACFIISHHIAIQSRN